MKKYNVGIICPSEIAFRRFLPSLKRVEEFQFVGVAIASPEEWAGEGKVTEATLAVIDKERQKARTFVDCYGGRIFEGYQTLIDSPEVDTLKNPLLRDSLIHTLYFLLQEKRSLLFMRTICLFSINNFKQSRI